jgi:hypothetical protein
MFHKGILAGGREKKEKKKRETMKICKRNQKGEEVDIITTRYKRD